MSNGKGLVLIGCLLAYLGHQLLYMTGPILAYSLMVIGLVILPYGCFLWVKWKNRHWAFMLWCILAPIGLIGIVLLKAKEKDGKG